MPKLIECSYFNLFTTFCLTDVTGRCLAVNLYNLAPGKGVIIGDSVAIPEPLFSKIKVENEVRLINELWEST